MCPKCQRNIWKYIDSTTRCCVNCGTVILDQLVVVMQEPLQKCYRRLPDVEYIKKHFDDNQSNHAKAIRCREYIIVVFEHIKNELWRGKTWHQVDMSLQPRRDAQCVKTLRKYYLEEVKRRDGGPSYCVVEGGL